MRRRANLGMSVSHSEAANQGGALEALRTKVRKLIAEDRLDTVGVCAGDFNGILRGKYLPADAFVERIENPVMVSDMLFAFDPIDGVCDQGPDGFWWPLSERGLKEMRCAPVPSSFRLVPWRDRTALVLGSFSFNDRSPVVAEPRRVLQRVVDRARASGFEPRVGYELEFYAFQETAESMREKGYRDLSTLAPRQAWSMSGTAAQERLLRALRAGLTDFGIPVEAWTVEGGRGQYEINVPYCDALEAADRALLHRFAVKEIADGLGLTVTFMARPPGSAYGSSLHLHHSLWGRDGRNAMSDAGAEHGLSDVARSFVAGQLEAQSELISMLAPFVNSYKRLLRGMSSGASRTWGVENWSAAIRVINASPEKTRAEMRTAGADANPYLAIAATLAAGMSGVERKLTLTAPTTGLAENDAAVEYVPGSLEAGLRGLGTSEVARDFFGAEFVEVYAATRRAELDAFQAVVTDWEADRYLRVL